MRHIQILLFVTAALLRPITGTAVLLAGILACWTAAAAFAADVKVIANPSISASSLSSDELQRIFLQTKSSLEDGTHVQAVLEKSGSTHEAFVKAYLGKTDAALQTYYRSLVFTGKGSMPKTVSSDAEMVSFVSRTKGAIGYISASAPAAGTKTIEVK